MWDKKYIPGKGKPSYGPYQEHPFGGLIHSIADEFICKYGDLPEEELYSNLMELIKRSIANKDQKT